MIYDDICVIDDDEDGNKINKKESIVDFDKEEKKVIIIKSL